MTSFAGKRVLIVEDEALIAAMLADILADGGAQVVGPAATLDEGLEKARVEVLHAAILDINLGGKMVDPVADALSSRSIPFVFTSGYGSAPWIERFGAPIIDKPYQSEDIVEALSRMLLLHS
jgi:CheY-like chemotaxis protein